MREFINLFEKIVHVDKVKSDPSDECYLAVALNPTRGEFNSIHFTQRGGQPSCVGVVLKDGSVCIGEGTCLDHETVMHYAGVSVADERYRLQIWDGKVVIELWIDDEYVDTLPRGYGREDVDKIVLQRYGETMEQAEAFVQKAISRFTDWPVKARPLSYEQSALLEMKSEVAAGERGDFRVYMNPMPSQLAALKEKHGALRGIVDDENVYLGDAHTMVHMDLMEAIKLTYNPSFPYDIYDFDKMFFVGGAEISPIGDPMKNIGCEWALNRPWFVRDDTVVYAESYNYLEGHQKFLKMVGGIKGKHNRTDHEGVLAEGIALRYSPKWSYGAEEYPVYKNVGRSTLDAILASSKDNDDRARGLFTDKGDLYIWDAYGAVHAAIMVELGINSNQCIGVVLYRDRVDVLDSRLAPGFTFQEHLVDKLRDSRKLKRIYGSNIRIEVVRDKID